MTKKYTKKQISLIFRLRKQGLSSQEILKRDLGLPAINAQTLQYLVQANKGKLESKTQKNPRDLRTEISKGEILKKFLSWVSKNAFIPNLAEFCRKTTVDSRAITKMFGNFDALEEAARRKDPKVFERIIDERSFTSQKFADLRSDVNEHKRFFITTAVTGCRPHTKGLQAVKTYCKANNAKLLVILVSDPANSKPKKYKFSAHQDLPADGIVFRDLMLNKNLGISTIKLQAKQINPLTGLRSLALKGSCILGSPKQVLEPVPTSNKCQVPHHLFTTGAITIPEYETKKYMSERTAYLARDAHVLGGVIVEVQDDKTFFYRHVQINPRTGAFTDINRQYLPDSKIKKVTARVVVQPDWHTGFVNTEYRRAAREIIQETRPDHMTLEDFCDNISINPFDRRSVANRAKFLKDPDGFHSLEEELAACSNELSELSSWEVKHVLVKWGNHDDFLRRWLAQADYAEDEINYQIGVRLAHGMLDETPPFEHAMRELFPFDGQEKVTFLGIRDSFKIDGIEQAVHGHLGSGGKRNPGLKGLEVYGPCNTGHTHAAGILKGVFRVGTATDLQLSYNEGASAWSNTCLIQHRDGGRQLVTVIDGKWRLPTL